MSETISPKRTRRGNGDGSLKQAPDGSWRGAIRVRDATGREARRYVRGKTKQAVVAKLNKLRSDPASAAAARSKLTVGDYLTRWIDSAAEWDRPVRGATLRGYKHHVEAYWVPLLGHVRLSELTPSQVNATIDSLAAKGLSAMTIRHVRSTLRRALHDAQREDRPLVTRNAASESKVPEIKRTAKPHTLTIADGRRMIDETRNDPFGPLYAVALGTGLRLGELLGLHWSDVTNRELTVAHALNRETDGSYVVGSPKTETSARTVVLTKIAREGFERQRELQAEARAAAGVDWQDEDLVFTDELGRFLPPARVSGAWRRTADRLGLDGVRFHDLRHSYATLALEAGIPIELISKSLGHSGIGITMAVYAHVTDKLRNQVAAGLDEAFAGS